METIFFQNAAGNDVAVISATFQVGGVTTDPSTVACVVTDPTGTAVTHTFGGSPPNNDITRTAAGIYTLSVGCTIVGLWSYVFVGTGAASDIQPGTFTVNPASTIGQFYTSTEELKDRLKITDTQDDFQLTLAVQAAAKAIEDYTGRFFYQLTETRTFVPYCADTETEILARDGWRRYDQLRVGDEVLTLNTSTGLSEWQPVEAVNYFPGRHEVIRLRTGSHSSMTTPQHRWPVIIPVGPHSALRQELHWCTTETARSDAKILAGAPVSAPAQAKWSDSLVELVAWFWTEGTVTASQTVSICQSERVNPGNVARIRGVLRDLLGAPGGVPAGQLGYRCPAPAGVRASRLAPAWHEDHGERGIVKFRLNQLAARALLLEHAPGKVVKTGWLAQLTRAQLELFISVSLDADGSRCNGQEHMAQKDRDRLDAFQIACVLAGRSMEITRQDSAGMWHGSVRTNHLRSPWNHQLKNRLPRVVVEGVWCPRTANGTWFARRDGTVYATGNSLYEQPLDDLVSVTSFAVDNDGDGIYEQAWTLNVDYNLEIEPYEFNQFASGEARPYTVARVINSAGGGRFFPFIWPFAPLNRIQIAGTWGWPAVPLGVKQAALQVATEFFKLKDVPFGLAGSSEYGVVRIPKVNPYIAKLLDRYRHPRRKVGIGS